MSYCEIPEFSSARWVVARKQHTCCECHSPIMIGEKHGYFAGKNDGPFWTYRQHIECEDACTFVRDHLNHHECLCFGELFDWYDEQSGFLKHDSNDKDFRKIMARVKWRAEKKRPLSWIPKYDLYQTTLKKVFNDRNF